MYFQLILCLVFSMQAQEPPPTSLIEEAQGTVRVEGGTNPVAAKVTLKGTKTSQVTTVATDNAGKFTAKLPSEATYEIKVEAANYATSTLNMPKEGLKLIDITLSKANPACCLPGENDLRLRALLWFLALYWFVALAARYFNIASIDQANIAASIESIKTPSSAAIQPLITNAEEALRKAKGFKSFFLGFRGKEIAARQNIAEARIRLADTYSREELIAELRLIVEFLRPDYSSLATKVEAVLTSVTATEPSTPFLQATYVSALRAANEKSAAAYSAITNWQNKAFSLIFLGCVLLGTMAVVLDNHILIFVGLIGGFLSRLMRGKTMATAGASSDLRWTTLLLSPLYGAFAGWAGVLILSGAKELKLLGEVFQFVIWGQSSCSSLSLGIAFLLGFSERFFSAVTDMAENALLKQKNANASDSPNTTPTPTNPNAGIPPAIPMVTTAAAEKDTVTFTGQNLKNVKEIALEGVTPALAIKSQSETQLVAVAAKALDKGSYAITIDGKPSGKSVVVP